jgi:hypothetical protein
MISIHRNVIGGQAKGSWLAIQIGFTLVTLRNLWPRDHHAGPWLKLFIAAPSHDPQIGYRRKHFGIWISTPRGRPNARISIGAGDGFGLPRWMT